MSGRSSDSPGSGDGRNTNRPDKRSDDRRDNRNDHRNANHGDNPADWLVAHRGFPDAFPENSMAGMQAALQAGTHFVEFDVQLSRDGVPVVIHDPTLERVGGRNRHTPNPGADNPGAGNGDRAGAGDVGAMNWNALSMRTIGEVDRFGPRFAAQRVPHLAEMLELVGQYPGVTAFVELKRQSLERFGTTAMVEPVLAEIRNAATPCVVISFDAAAVDSARDRAGLPIGLGIKPWDAANRSQAERLAPDYLFIRHDRIPAGERPFWPGAWQWVVYVVDDLASACAWRERGADLIETDRLPSMLSTARETCTLGRD